MKKCHVFEERDYKELPLSEDEIAFSKRMVAFLDVLGFKAKLEVSDREETAEIYRQLLGIINDTNKRLAEMESELCKLFVFSDSVVLVANGDSNKDIAEFISAVWKFLQLSIAVGMPFRGGISYGDVYVNEAEKVFLGNPIVRAVKLEGQQEWMGVTCDSFAEERILLIEDTDDWESIVPKILTIDYLVPFKDGKAEKRKVINWRFNLIAEAGIESLFKNECNRVDVEMKIKNTLEFSKFVRKTGVLYLSDSVQGKLREKFVSMYVGKSKPPFKNGDEY